MIQIVKAGDRHFTDVGWLQTYWLFSFSDYYDPKNLRHGRLRVFNDDIVKQGKGFPTHPHEEMEIITLVLKGEITHKDSMGNQGIIRAGEVQRMSAGTGLTHSEYNRGDTDLAFYQIWINPDFSGLSPSYEQKKFQEDEFKNRLVPIASGQGKPGAVTFHTDATIYRSILEKNHWLEFNTNTDRMLFIYVSYGRIEINGQVLGQKDQARIDTESCLSIKGLAPSDFILIDTA